MTSSITSDHNRIKVDLNNKKNHRKYSNTCRLNNTMPKDQWVTKEIREVKKFLEYNENENTIYQNVWDRPKAAVR
jgi:hypothetical protein